VTSTNVDAKALTAVQREALKRRVYHQKRIDHTTNTRARKWQSTAWLAAELAQYSDAEAAEIVQRFARQLNEGSKT
jgi:hypothetical protein